MGRDEGQSRVLILGSASPDVARGVSEETTSLAAGPACAEVVESLDARLRAICDPEATDARAHADPAAMIEAYGGREAALKLGASGAKPAPALRA
ncbi:MAG: hypothetical protein OXU81_05040 [Gammaproteobacteria bacterium]|nr:hypothetical protein [Gammaproteobacteria bacterium]